MFDKTRQTTKKEKEISSMKITIPLAVAFKGLFDAALGAKTEITIEEAEARLREGPYVGRYKDKNIFVTFIGKVLYFRSYNHANGRNKGIKTIMELEEDKWGAS